MLDVLFSCAKSWVSRSLRRSREVAARAGFVIGFAGMVVGVVLGCVAMPIPGGQVVSHDYRPQILVAYEADGEAGSAVRYFLVRQAAGVAFFEQTGKGAGTVLERHWTDEAGDHFAVWAPLAAAGDAVEVLVPIDRTQPAYRFVYPSRLYDVRNDSGGERPIPKMLIEASTQLRPVEPRGDAAPPH